MTAEKDWTRFDAALFDMDGVITRTASLHAAAWKALFDEYLSQRAGREDEAFRPFDEQEDYRNYVDGKLREDGVASFLASRGIVLPSEPSKEGEDGETIAGLAQKK